MDERAAFAAAIRADPTAALPRLQFADWLEEQGETDAAEWLRLDVRHGEAWASHASDEKQRALWLLSENRTKPDGVDPLKLCRILAGWVR